MRKMLTFWTTLLLLSGLVLPLQAQTDDSLSAESEQPAEEPEVISIPALLKEVKYVTKVQPKKKASVYFFLRSHSRCGFCRKISAQMNDLYKEMKNKGAELIMLNGDPDTETALKWAEEASITIPMITPETASVIASKVPGGGSGGSPNVMAVMADGSQIEGTSGASKTPLLVGGWKDMVKEARKAQAKKKAETSKAKKSKKGKKKKSKKTASESEAV